MKIEKKNENAMKNPEKNAWKTAMKKCHGKGN